MLSARFTRFASSLLVVGATALLLAVSYVPASADITERAAIIPVATQKLGGDASSGAGYTLNATGISGYWSTTKSGTVTFVVFVYPGVPMKAQDITLMVVAPDGKTVVSTYTFKAQQIGLSGSWYTFPQTADYSAAGIYQVIVTSDSVVIGSIPLVFAPPTK
jgi:hypothetical protein